MYVLPFSLLLQRRFCCTQSVTSMWHAEGTFGGLPTQAGQGMYNQGNDAVFMHYNQIQALDAVQTSLPCIL